MKKFLAMLSFGAAIAIAAPSAHADLLSLTGYETFNLPAAGDLSFSGPFTAGGGTGVFSTFNGGDVSFTNFNFLNLGAGVPIFSVQNLSSLETVTYTLTSDTFGVNGAGDPYLDGSGVFTFTNASGSVLGTSAGTFDATTQAAGGQSLVSFSATDTTAVTPEPSSLMLLGTGLVGTAGMLFRRRRA